MASIVIDCFAGGGGASSGIRDAGYPIDYAINHDPKAIVMHKANHPETYHYCEDVRDVDPRVIADGRHVSLAWFSPDCTHHSRAKGGRPVNKNIRGLAWVVNRYAATVKPDVMFLENVEEFAQWGPLMWSEEKQGMVPDPSKVRQTFNNWKKDLGRLGYEVDYRSLIAADYGAPTSRKRLFLVARRDGKPIVWPAPTHGIEGSPYRTAAEIIDWSIPCPSIFSRKRPLADNTMRRIAKGLEKFVINSPDPFIMVTSHAGRGDARRNYSLNRPLTTILSQPDHYLISPYVIKHNTDAGAGRSVELPFPTIMGRNTQNQLLTAFLTRWFGKSVGGDVEAPAPSTTAGGGGKTGLVTSHLIKLRGTNLGNDMRDLVPTITAGGTHLGEIRAFLLKYYGTAIGQSLDVPAHSITSKARFGLVTIHGESYQIVDIGMRMLQPRELFLAQGFKEDYIIDPIYNGKPLTKTAQIQMVGNSVSPHPAEALVRANMAA